MDFVDMDASVTGYINICAQGMGKATFSYALQIAAAIAPPELSPAIPISSLSISRLSAFFNSHLYTDNTS